VTSLSDSQARNPEWFAAFRADRGTRKPSPHTMRAYDSDFSIIAAIIVGDGHVWAMQTDQITVKVMRNAFAEFAKTHEAASIRRAWSTWNVLCNYLCSSELIATNPMSFVGRPKVAKALPKAIPCASVAVLLNNFEEQALQPPSRGDWFERDRAIVAMALLAGLRADELRRADIGDVRLTDNGAVVRVCGKGEKDRRIPIERPLVDVVQCYLDSRALRFPDSSRHANSPIDLAAWSPTLALFVGTDGERITRGTLQYRVRRAYRRAGIDSERARGALVHALRHTFATELANAGVSVYALMNLLGHESMTTSQRYVTAAGTDTRAAAATNGLYTLLPPGAA
jgi:site-specific recombinase XerC